MNNKSVEIRNEVKKVIVGKDDVIDKVMMAILSGGHILLEDVPGVGKTTLALAFSKALGIKYKRVQFTPDSVPSDITGFTMYDKENGRFKYIQGAAMTNLLLADEINRTSGRTQSALLEVMEEGNVTVDGQSYSVPQPFVVIATQNPSGWRGTQPLPNAQLDRFMIRLEMGYPEKTALIDLLKDRHNTNPMAEIRSVVSENELIAMKREAEQVFISDEIYEYISQLVEASRNHEMIQLGVSPRGALALCRMAKAKAYVSGRNYVIPEDISFVFTDVLSHRIILEAKAKLSEVTEKKVLEEIIEKVGIPNIG